jgi:hypothetical protein
VLMSPPRGLCFAKRNWLACVSGPLGQEVKLRNRCPIRESVCGGYGAQVISCINAVVLTGCYAIAANCQLIAKGLSILAESFKALDRLILIKESLVNSRIGVCRLKWLGSA